MPESLQEPVSPSPRTLADQIQHSLHVLIAATIVLYLMLGGVVAFVYIDSANRRADIENLAEDTAGALCSVRADLQRRVDNSKQFLLEHPEGIPSIPPAVILKSIADTESTVEALSELECPAPDVEG